MKRFTQVAIAAAAVLVVLVAGYSLLPGFASIGGPLATPTASASPVATSTVIPTSTGPVPLVQAPTETGPGGPDLVPGTYYLSASQGYPTKITFDVPAGWFNWDPDPDFNGILVDKADASQGSGWGLVITTVGLVSTDPCDPGKGPRASPPHVAGSVDSLVAVMARWPGFSVTTPQAIVIDGFRGALIEVSSTRSPGDCPSAVLWTTAGGHTVDGYPMVASTHPVAQFRILDIGGSLVVIRTTDFPETSPNELAGGLALDPRRHALDQAALRQIVASIRFELLQPTPAPSK
jgi:hypothetical protein